jgi:hypothetical protein
VIELLKTCVEHAKRGVSIKPGVERSGTPGSSKYTRKAREVGDRPFIKMNRRFWAIARFARSFYSGSSTWGFASLHPRLYASARSAGLGNEVRTNLFRAS